MQDPLALVSAAADFAARRHSGQTLKGRKRAPYVNHLAEVAALAASAPAGCDAQIIAAAWLHDCVEDGRATAAEIEALAGARVRSLVAELTDDMSLPDEEARALGIPTGPLRAAVVAAATLVTAASVAAAGIVGWVGLVVPHLARFLVGPSFPRLLPASAILGGGYLLLIDTLARTAAPVEIPLGILTATVGTPFFIALLRRAHRGWA